MAAYRKTGTRLLTGVAELDQKLATIKLGEANKITRPALTKGAGIYLKKMKAAVPSPYKDAKRALGSVVDAKGGKYKNEQRAKVGAGVGKANKAMPKRSKGSKGGVGIGGRNIHWFVMGTSERTQTTTGKSTGRMPPILLDIVKGPANAAKAEVIATIKKEVTTRLAALAKSGK